MKPFLKYVGGKTKLLPVLKQRMPPTYARYFEPFVGGGSLFFDLEPATAVLGDMNEALIETYDAVATQTEPLIYALEKHRKRYLDEGSSYYYEVRESWNDGAYEDSLARRGAAFIFLNKTCFNGLWRVNRAGEFNVPAGKYKNPGIFDPALLRAAAVALQRSQRFFGDYQKTTASAGAGDFVYIDPPYAPISKTSNFTSYTKETFGEAAQAQLAKHAEELRARGAFVLLSNNDTPIVRALYQDFRIETVKCARSINSDATKRGAIDEVIIMGYERAKQEAA